MSEFRGLEKLVARIQAQLAPTASVRHDVRLKGHTTGLSRQIDVLVSDRIGQYEIIIVIECKDYKSPADIKAVEAFAGMLEDVKAQRGVMVCPKGFSKGAKKLATAKQIDLYSPIDTEPHKWTARVTVPAICDFRYAAIGFLLKVSAASPWQVPYDFLTSLKLFDLNDQPLGTAWSVALQKWNQGKFPIEPGRHSDLLLSDDPMVKADNGYGSQIAIRLTAKLKVTRKLFYGQYPIAKMSGFKDEIGGAIIANAFEIGLLDPDDVARYWQEVDTVEAAPIRPVLVLQGLVGTAD